MPEACGCCHVGNDELNAPARCWSFHMELRCQKTQGHLGRFEGPHVNESPLGEDGMTTIWGDGDPGVADFCPRCGMTRESFGALP